MISLIRSGPEAIAMKISEQVTEIRHKLSAWGALISLDPESSLKKYGPARRLVFLRIQAEDESIDETYVSENPLEMLLATLINSRVSSGVESIGVMPGYVMMRLMGDIERGIRAIQKDLGGEIIDSRPFYRPDIPGTSSTSRPSRWRSRYRNTTYTISRCSSPRAPKTPSSSTFPCAGSNTSAQRSARRTGTTLK